MRNAIFMRALTCVAVLTMVLCGCRSEPAEPDQRFTTEKEAAMIEVAREAATAHGWPLDDRIYSVRRDGSGWIVQVDLAPGYNGDGEPSVVVDGTFFVHINAEGSPTRLLSHGRDIQLAPASSEPHNQ
jgi:hypothetical protein